MVLWGDTGCLSDSHEESTSWMIQFHIIIGIIHMPLFVVLSANALLIRIRTKFLRGKLIIPATGHYVTHGEFFNITFYNI